MGPGCAGQEEEVSSRVIVSSAEIIDLVNLADKLNSLSVTTTRKKVIYEKEEAAVAFE